MKNILLIQTGGTIAMSAKGEGVELDPDTWAVTLYDRIPELNELAVASKGFTGAELEEAVKEAMFLAFDEGHQLNKNDILKSIQATSPLSSTMAEMIQDTRAWAKGRAVAASSAEPEALDPSGIKKPRLKQEGENPFVKK